MSFVVEILLGAALRCHDRCHPIPDSCSGSHLVQGSDRPSHPDPGSFLERGLCSAARYVSWTILK